MDGANDGDGPESGGASAVLGAGASVGVGTDTGGVAGTSTGTGLCAGERRGLPAKQPRARRQAHCQIARLLAEIDKEGIFVRGVFVDDACRGKGYSRLILTTFAALCFKCFGEAPKTRVINKPILAVSLESMGFVP